MPTTVSHYRVLHPLGEGAMGEVYAGFDDTLHLRVALKAIRAEHRLNDVAKARFLREARIRRRWIIRECVASTISSRRKTVTGWSSS